MSTRQLLPLIGALFALYIIWGSTYFAIAVGVASWPPLMMAGIRFLAAGVLLLGWLLATGHKLPARRPLLNAALIGVLLLAVGNGFVTLAEHQYVPSGIAAVMVATVPLFTLCFSRFFGIATRKLEWLGIAIGLAGIVMLNSGGNLNGNPWGAPADPDWFPKLGLRSVYGSRIVLPTGMMAGAIEMLAAGIVLLAASWLSGETLTRVPSWSGIAALAYLAIFGSLIAINAYMFLIRNVTPAVATSYAYVNPVVAVFLGTGFGGESLSLIEWLALAVIIFAVVLVTLGKYLFPVRSEATPCKASK
ncbi:drug/metabolite transporter permease [Klebsiella pneumoniae subsp. rhinoscleromatis]|nr:drug/metabolite transporter permease [Klebsiella pneumoniae subsp. rhinoscleromatis]